MAGCHAADTRTKVGTTVNFDELLRLPEPDRIAYIRSRPLMEQLELVCKGVEHIGTLWDAVIEQHIDNLDKRLPGDVASRTEAEKLLKRLAVS